MTKQLTTRFHHNTIYSTYKSATAANKPLLVAWHLGNVCNPFVCNQITGTTPYFSNTGVTNGLLTSTALTGNFPVRDRSYATYASGSHVMWHSTLITVLVRNNSDAVFNMRVSIVSRRRRDTYASAFDDWISDWMNGDIYNYNKDDYVVHQTRRIKFDLSTEGNSQRQLKFVVPQRRIVWTDTRQAAVAASSWNVGWENSKYLLIEHDDVNDTQASDVCVLIRNNWTEGKNY